MSSHFNKNNLTDKKRDGKKEKNFFPKIKSNHHITPQSRGGSDSAKNMVKIIHVHHQKYHYLFSNMIPYEILAWLESYFWGNQTEWIDKYVFDRDSIIDGIKMKYPEDSSPKLSTTIYITPFSRGGGDCVNNKSKVVAIHSYKYQDLFSDMTPFEILAWLELYFWGKQKKWINNYVVNR